MYLIYHGIPICHISHAISKKNREPETRCLAEEGASEGWCIWSTRHGRTFFSMGIAWGITQLSRLANLNQFDMDFFYETLPNFANLI